MSPTDTATAEAVRDAAQALNLAMSQAHKAGLRVSVGVDSVNFFGERFPLKVVSVSVYREV
jgi:hypothetical protein